MTKFLCFIFSALSVLGQPAKNHVGVGAKPISGAEVKIGRAHV